jgi:hypothetical protein
MKKLLLLLIIPFLSFGQCEDPIACNYEITDYPSTNCEYINQGCAIEYFPFGPEQPIWEYVDFYVWDDNCQCSPPIGCEDELACNYGLSFDGYPSQMPPITNEINDWFLALLDSYNSVPYCMSIGDSCNVFNEGYVLPLPLYNEDGERLDAYAYSGIFNENCECVCVNPNASIFYINGLGDILIPNEFILYEGCPEINIEENTRFKSLITIIDILGRENTNKGFQLHIYDDGSVEKKYLIK